MNQQQVSSTDDRGDLLNRGNQLFDQGSYESAICEYIKVMQTNTLRYQYFCKRGIYFTQLGKDQSAIHNFIQQYHINLQDLAQYLRGIANDYMNQFYDAIQNFTQIIQRCPQFKYCFNDRGNAYRSLMELENAIEDYTEAIQQDKQYAEAYYKREEAILDYTKAIDINPMMDYFYIDRGMVLNELGRKEEAIKDFTITIELNPLEYNSFYYRGIIFDELGRREEAIHDFNRAIDINPQYISTYINRGIALNSVGRKEEAIKDYSKVIEIDQKYAKAYQNRGVLLDEQGRKEEARIDFSKAIELNPLDDTSYYNRGTIFYELRRKEEALNDFTKAININPSSGGYYNRGNVQYDLVRKEEAIKDYTQAIEMNPQDDKSYQNRGIVLDELGIKEEAYQDYLKSHQLQPYEPLYNLQLGRFLLSNGEKQRAHDFFVQGLKLASSLSQEDKRKFNSLEQYIEQIQQLVELFQQIELEIFKVNQLIKSQTLSENQQKNIEEIIKPIEEEFQNKINKPFKKVDNNQDKNILQRFISKIRDIKQLQKKQFNLNYMKISIFIINHYIGSYIISFQSVNSFLQTYFQKIQMLQQIMILKESLKLLAKQSNNNQIKLGLYLYIPIVGTVITIISSALQFVFSSHQDYKFKQIIRKLTQIIQDRCSCKNDVDQEIQLDQELKEQRLQEYVEQIQEVEKNSGNTQTQNPYWKQGVVDTLRILRNLLVNQKQIQMDCKKELNIVILESLKEYNWQVDHLQVVKNSGRFCQRCSNKCSIQ